MKKYCLVKTYPNSVELGTIVENVFDEYGVQFAKYPEFWEKVEEKDYEILKYNDGFNDYFKKENSKWTINLQHEYDGKDLFNRKDMFIKSIKRLSDGEIFTIGNKVSYTGKKCSYNNFIIEDFFIRDDGILARNSSIGELIGDLKHVKEHLFTTFDGVNIFEGDEVWFLNSKMEIWHASKLYDKSLIKKLTFSTKELAEAYIEENQFKYSEKDMLDFGLHSAICRINGTSCDINYIFNNWKLK